MYLIDILKLMLQYNTIVNKYKTYILQKNANKFNYEKNIINIKYKYKTNMIQIHYKYLTRILQI